MPKVIKRSPTPPARSLILDASRVNAIQILLAVAMLGVVLVQAKMLSDQNKKIDEQIYISQAAPSWQALPQIQQLAVKLRTDAGTVCLDMKRLHEEAKVLGDLVHPPCWSDLFRLPRSATYRYEWLRIWNLQQGKKSQADLFSEYAGMLRYQDAPSRPFDIQGFAFGPNAYLMPDAEATAIAEVITDAMLPYRSLDSRKGTDDEAPRLSARPISRERALVLKQFLNNGFRPVGNFENSMLDNIELRNVQLGGIRLRDASLRCALIAHSDLMGATLTGADLSNARFDTTDLRLAVFSGAILDGVSFDKTLMPSPHAFTPVSLRGAKLEGAIVGQPDWLEALAKVRPAIEGYNASEWKLMLDEPHHGFTILRREEAKPAREEARYEKSPILGTNEICRARP
jgi:hypothetical protein